MLWPASPDRAVLSKHPNATETANAQIAADYAISVSGRNWATALNVFDDVFSKWYVGQRITGLAAGWNAFITRAGARTLGQEYQGQNDFKELFQEKVRWNEDQTHHLATYLSAGLNAAPGGALDSARRLHQWRDNDADSKLGDYGFNLGQNLVQTHRLLSTVGVDVKNVCKQRGAIVETEHLMKAYILPIVLGLWVGFTHAFEADSGAIYYQNELRMMVEYAICFILMTWIFRSIGLARWPVIWVPLVVITGSIIGSFVAMSIPDMLYYYPSLPPEQQEPMWRIVLGELQDSLVSGCIVGSLSTLPVFIVLGIIAGVMKLVRRHPPNTMAT